MRTPHPLFAALAALVPVAAGAQIPRGNPLVDASHAIAASGLGTETRSPDANSVFTPIKGRLFVHEFASHLGKDAAKQTEIEQGILAVIGVYEKSVKKAGQANDVATALGFSVAELYATEHGKEIDPTAFQVLVPRFRAALAKVESTDRQKQEFYEYALSCAGAVMTLAVSEDEESKARAKDLSGILLEALTGAKADAIVLDGENVEIGGAKAESAPASAEEPAPKAVPATGGAVVGEWRWSSTGTTTNWNTTTGAYAGLGHGMSKHYVFKSDGSFTQDSLIQVNTSGHRTTVFITAEGRYQLKAGQISFTILKGHLRGEDNMLSSGNYDKPMPEETMRKISETHPYSVRTVDGKLCFILHLGTEPKDDMIFRTLAK